MLSTPALHKRRAFVPVNGNDLLALPATVFLVGCFLYPLLYILVQSFQNHSIAEYALIWRTPVYLRVIGLTFRTAFLVTGICLVLGYAYAYAMCHAKRNLFAILMATLLVPFWVSLLLRTFSWMILLQDTGVINRVLLDLGVIDQPLHLIRNTTGVVIGMVHVLLPYAVLPMYTVMKKIDNRMTEAARICGAGAVRAFVRVFLPLSMPGIIAAGIMCFTLSLGFYITPALLGGPLNTMIGQLIASEISDQLDFPFASALSVVLLFSTAITFSVLGLALKWSNRSFKLKRAS
jgi:ABC-type spermidine/putrescine transport system permease subunit I